MCTGRLNESLSPVHTHTFNNVYYCLRTCFVETYAFVTSINFPLKAGWQADRQTDRQTDRQAGRPTDRQTGRQAGPILIQV